MIKLMFFSEWFEVDSNLIKEYGAVDISLVCDVPLFVDPMLIFNSEKKEYRKLHENMIRYFHFLYKKSSEGLLPEEIDAWFNFSEVPNNWLGYALVGNKGKALGKEYAQFLYKNISFAIETHGISQSQHIEKTILLCEGSGKDKISDLTVNLIKGFLCKYTEIFAVKYIKKELVDTFLVDKVGFNYKTESFISKSFKLPYVYNDAGKKEYVLLTPFDILREDEPAINRKDFLNSYNRILSAIDNADLRAYVNNYIGRAVKQYEERQNQKHRKTRGNSLRLVEKQAFKDLVKEVPELYDYYIKLRENDTDVIQAQCLLERDKQQEKLFVNSNNLIALYVEHGGCSTDEHQTAREEAKSRLLYFKHIIEDCDGYKNLYHDEQPIASEKDLQRLFRFVWYGTKYKVDQEVNNGRGASDFIVSMGQNDQRIVEFKLASNSSLSHMFKQVKIYEVANCTDGSLIAIFCFSEAEYESSRRVVIKAGYESFIGKSIFLIDCRKDNKTSASKI